MVLHTAGLKYRFVLFDRRTFSTPPLINSNLSSPPNVWLGSGWLHSTLKAMPVSVAWDVSQMAHLASHRGVEVPNAHPAVVL